MKYKVDLNHGHIIFDESDYKKALAIFKQEGTRMFILKDIFDEGTLLYGLPVVKDLINFGSTKN